MKNMQFHPHPLTPNPCCQQMTMRLHVCTSTIRCWITNFIRFSCWEEMWKFTASGYEYEVVPSFLRLLHLFAFEIGNTESKLSFVKIILNSRRKFHFLESYDGGKKRKEISIYAGTLPSKHTHKSFSTHANKKIKIKRKRQRRGNSFSFWCKLTQLELFFLFYWRDFSMPTASSLHSLENLMCQLTKSASI